MTIAEQEVLPEHLSLAVRAMFHARSRPTGPWEAATRYNPTDLISHEGATYICLSYHVSGTDFTFDRDTLTRWMIFSTVNTAVATAIQVTPVGGVAATTVQGAIAELDSEKMAKAANLADVADAASARTNLGVTATGADTAYAFRSNNLSDLSNAATARNNLGLGALATLSAIGSAQITDGAIVNGDVNSSAAIDTSKLSFLQAGTGGTARTVQDRLRDWVSIRDFSNDAAGITAALAAHPHAIVPPGTYNTTTARTVGAGKILEFMGDALPTSSGAGSWALAAGGSVISKNEGIEGNVWYSGRKLTGAINTGNGPFDGYSPTGFMWDIRADDATLPDAGVDPFLVGHRQRHIVVAGYAGSRIGTHLTLQVDGTPSGTADFLQALQTSTVVTTNQGGTNTGAGAKGHVYGGGMAAYAMSGATNLGDLTGCEFNTFAATGSSARYSSGLSIAGVNDVRGALLDCGLRISAAAGHVGWNIGIAFTDSNSGAPLYSGSTLLGTYWTGGGTKTIDKGIDLSGFTVTTAAFLSNGFSVDGNGDLVAAAVRPTGTITLVNSTGMRWNGPGGPFDPGGTEGAQLFQFSDGTLFLDNYDGGFIWRGASFATLATLTSGGAFRATGSITAAPGASVTPANNGDVTFQLTSNTSLTFKAKGSDGTVRSGSIVLA